MQIHKFITQVYYIHYFTCTTLFFIALIDGLFLFLACTCLLWYSSEIISTSLTEVAYLQVAQFVGSIYNNGDGLYVRTADY